MSDWSLFTTDVPQTWLELQTILLAERGITTSQDEQAFFAPATPFELTASELGIDQAKLTTACQLLFAAKQSNQKIVIFGDYDADGVCATSLVWRVLHELGCQVVPFIPDRHRHGYGLTVGALEEIWAEHQPDLIITVDNGIVAHQAAAWAIAQGCTLIITDHHQPEGTAAEPQWPAHTALVHTTALCGTTVAWIVMRELAFYFQAQASEPVSFDPVELLTKELDLCGIATITDQVPLLGANRSFAVAGLAALQTTSRPGLVALYQIAGWEQAESTTTTINYGIGPRLNAMGRLKNGMEAVRLLCTSVSDRAYQLAELLNETNIERQELTAELLALADAELVSKDQAADKLIITAHEEYHQGVIGLIAGKLVETHNKPAIVLNIAGEVAKASVRSVPGINIIDLLRLVQDDLLEVGGHPLAAGFSVRVDKLAAVSERLQKLAREYISETAVSHRPVVAELPSQLVNLTTAQNIQLFAPFGQGNREPLFLLPAHEVLEMQPFGRDMTHLRLTILPTQTDQPDLKVQPLKVLWWRGVEQSQRETESQVKIGSLVDLAVSLEANVWKGKESLQLVVADWQLVS